MPIVRIAYNDAPYRTQPPSNLGCQPHPRGYSGRYQHGQEEVTGTAASRTPMTIPDIPEHATVIATTRCGKADRDLTVGARHSVSAAPPARRAPQYGEPQLVRRTT